MSPARVPPSNLPSTGIVLDVYTNEPGIQIYAGNFLDGTLTGKKGIVYGRRASVCLGDSEVSRYAQQAGMAFGVAEAGREV